MSDAHEIVTLTPRMGIGSLGEGWTSAKIECSACPYVRFTGAPHHIATRVERWMPDHIAQHAPGRALDIEVVWEPSACCSVCEDGIGDIRQVSSEGLECIECGTTWDMDGRGGETSDDDE